MMMVLLLLVVDKVVVLLKDKNELSFLFLQLLMNGKAIFGRRLPKVFEYVMIYSYSFSYCLLYDETNKTIKVKSNKNITKQKSR